MYVTSMYLQELWNVLDTMQTKSVCEPHAVLGHVSQIWKFSSLGSKFRVDQGCVASTELMEVKRSSE